MSDKVMVLKFTGYTGIDILNNMLPKLWQTRIIARRLMKTMSQMSGGITPDPIHSYVVVETPWGSFRIMDASGNVQSCPHQSVPKP